MLIQDRFDYFFCGVLIVVVGGGGGDKWDCIFLVRDGRRSEGGELSRETLSADLLLE